MGHDFYDFEFPYILLDVHGYYISMSVNSSHSKSVLNVLNPALCFLLDPAGKNCRKYKLYTNQPFHKIFAIRTTRERTRKRKQSCITFGFVWTYN